LTSSNSQQDNIIGSTILEKKRAVELNIRQAEQKKLEVQRKRVEKIDGLGRFLQNANVLSAPGVILLIAIILGIRRSMKKRQYISHASDS